MSQMEEMDWCCPNCSAMWSIEEFDSQTCGCCGYPDHDEEDDEDDYYGDDSFWEEPVL